MTAAVERLAWVATTDVVTHVNGDLAQYLDHTFLCRYVSGEAHPADDESSDVRWWPLGGLPSMRPVFVERIATALEPSGQVRLG